MRVAVALALVAALVADARAAGNDEERARAHYEIGLGLYRLGDYRAALKEFAAGYELAHKPGFLLNLGQTYRKLGELREARDMYRQFLAEVRSDDPARPQAQKVLAELEAAIRAEPPVPRPATERPATAPATSKPATDEPPPTGPAETAAPAAAAAPTPAPVAATPSVQTSAPRPRRRALRIAGITVGVIGLALVGGGIGSAVAADHDARALDALDTSGAPFDPAKDHAYTVERTASTALFASGGVVAAAGIVLLVVGAR